MKPHDHVGRFELRQPLGQGAQATVWLAYDPRLQREVALKLLNQPGDEEDASLWLQEARNAGRLRHPSIVPVFEADLHDNIPFLVFEYVPGQTLAQRLRKHGALPAREAVAYLMDVLDALAAAHTEGVVHRDIKPSNILIDDGHRARVMDFGIAAQVQAAPQAQAGSAAVSGTVGYLAPEALRGQPVAPSMDLFACGVVLAEALMGHPLITDTDPHRALYRTAHEQLQLGTDVAADVDDALRAIVNQALALQPDERHADARAFFVALDRWMHPPATEAAGAGGSAGAASGGSSTLDFLLRRMRHKSDFPAMSEAVVRIQSMASSDTESVGSVTNEILKDVALTNKLLRVVNSAHFARGGSISTVSRAVALVGFNGIRNMALSLVLLEHMQDKAHAQQLKEEFLRSLMAGSISAQLCAGRPDAEEAFLGAMFQNLGRLLVQYYFPEEAAQIRSLVRASRDALDETTASVRVLGLSLAELGVGVARTWGLPVTMQRCMRRPSGEPPAQARPDSPEHVQWAALAANEMADALLHTEPKDLAPRMEALSARYARALGRNTREMRAATDLARTKLVEMAQAMEIRVTPGSNAARLLHTSTAHTDEAATQGGRGGPSLRSGTASLQGSTGGGSKATSAGVEGTDDGLSGFELQATQVRVDLPQNTAPQPRSDHVAQTLSAGIQDITNAMVEDFRLPDLLRMILETMLRALEFDRIIFCLRDARTDSITGRVGLGPGVESHVKAFKVPLKAATPDLFGVVCLKGVDSLISDSSEQRIHQRLPAWYLQTLNAPTFLLLPLQLKGAPLGLIYADKTERDSLELDDKELALLRTLRNQAVMAFRQAGG